MARLLSLRIDVPRDRGEAFPGDIFERRAIDDLKFRLDFFAKQSAS
jgi:hypothetical protein